MSMNPDEIMQKLEVLNKRVAEIKYIACPVQDFPFPEILPQLVPPEVLPEVLQSMKEDHKKQCYPTFIRVNLSEYAPDLSPSSERHELVVQFINKLDPQDKFSIDANSILNINIASKEIEEEIKKDEIKRIQKSAKYGKEHTEIVFKRLASKIKTLDKVL